MEIVFVIDGTLDKDFPTIAKCTRKCLARRKLTVVDFAGPVERLSSVVVRRKISRNCVLVFATTPKSENVGFTSDLTFDFSVLKNDRELENLIDGVESSLSDFRFDASNCGEIDERIQRGLSQDGNSGSRGQNGDPENFGKIEERIQRGLGQNGDPENFGKIEERIQGGLGQNGFPFQNNLLCQDNHTNGQNHGSSLHLDGDLNGQQDHNCNPREDVCDRPKSCLKVPGHSLSGRGDLRVQFDKEILCEDGTRRPLERQKVTIEKAAAALSDDRFKTITASLPW